VRLQGRAYGRTCSVQIKTLLTSLGGVQVEAGAGGKLGGVAARVGAAVEQASGGALKMLRIQVDSEGKERAVVAVWAKAAK
jgi:hypothetical protein